MSVRLEEGAYRRLRGHCARSGVPTSALVRTLVRRWLEEQEGGGAEASTEPESPEWDRQPGLFDEEGAPLERRGPELGA